MRHSAAIVLGLLIAATVAGASAAARAHASLALAGMIESRGAPDVGSAPAGGELLRFVPRGRFEIGLLLENRSHSRLVVTDARVLVPVRSLVHQIGTRFHPWHVFKCPPGAFCPFHGFGLKPGPAHPAPRAVAPGKDVGVELDFRLGSCAEIPLAEPGPISHLRVSFRTQTGRVRTKVFPLRGAELHLRMPKPEDCAQPRSSLSVDGPQRYESSYYWTIPGSKGDVCTVRGGTLTFRSRAYQTQMFQQFPTARSERIELRVAHFAATGTYRRGVVTVVLPAGKTPFLSRKAVVDVTKATTREVVAKVTAGRLPSATVRGTPFRVSGTMRCRVRG